MCLVLREENEGERIVRNDEVVGSIPESFITAGSGTGSAGCVKESLFSFPVGLLYSYNMPVQPGAPRIADDAGVIALPHEPAWRCAES